MLFLNLAIPRDYKHPLVIKRKVRFSLDGVVLLDKPYGASSQQALSAVKRLLGAEKAGHTGTLDPLATGLLPLCFGEATKFSQGLFDADKTYEAEIFLGRTTITGDAEGEVLSECPVTCTLPQVQSALVAFTGELTQTPPMYSALKKDGKPLYAYARAGETVERAARKIVIHTLALLRSNLPSFTVRVTCSKGTYIRTLAEDIGQYLGCGAYLASLRRTGVADLDITQAITLELLEGVTWEERVAMLAPLDMLVQEFPKITLEPALAERFMQGQRLSGMTGIDSVVRVYGQDGLLGVAHLAQGVLRPQRLISRRVQTTTLDLPTPPVDMSENV
ncbi:MAG: tRNA pseudouridine(55) synthase TruB [Ottowia sp.]|nr:tRNA pseudouridine(55) synthase TruB [Ottowia sp.]